MKRKRKTKSKPSLSVLHENVAGIDIGSAEHWVAAPPGANGEPNVRVFGTTTSELHDLAQWLREQGVRSVAMESTGVYWIPVYELLESEGFDVTLANARHLSHVPGRKTDMQDCQWIQLLHSCGLLRGSFRPNETIVALRTLRRQCANLVAESARAIQWMQKSLDQMNVQVHRAVSDLTGKTGMAIVRAIVAGERNPQRLAELRDPRCKKSPEQIAEYLTGTWRHEHLFNLQQSLHLYDHLQTMIASYEAQLQQQLQDLQPPERKNLSAPKHPNPRKEHGIVARGEQTLRHELFRTAGVDLTRIDGISATAATVVLSEVGLNLTAFPNEHHFVSWLRLSPKVPISGGKPLRKTRNSAGATRVAGVLRMAAVSLSRSNTALGAQFRRISRSKDKAVAAFATARRLAVLIYRLLRYGQDYVDIGDEAYEERFRQKRLRSLRTSAKSLGFHLVPLPPEP